VISMPGLDGTIKSGAKSLEDMALVRECKRLNAA